MSPVYHSTEPSRDQLDFLWLAVATADLPDFPAALSAAFARPVRLIRSSSLVEGLAHLRKMAFDAVILDLELPDAQGPMGYEQVRAVVPDLPVVALVGHDNLELAAAMIQRGLQDLLSKNRLSGELLAHSLRFAIERKRWSAELSRHARQVEESEARIRHLIEAAADAIVVTDLHGTVQFVNPAAESLFGRPAREMVGYPFGYPVANGNSTELDVLCGGQVRVAEMRVTGTQWNHQPARMASLRDITARKQEEEERERLISQLREALAHVDTLHGLLPICARCKRIRNDRGYWDSVETYIMGHSRAVFTHGLCPDCLNQYYVELPKPKGKAAAGDSSPAP